MSRYIDADKLIAKIDKISPFSKGGVEGVLNLVYGFIASLQQEQPSLPSNFDEAATKAYPKMSRLSEPHGVIPADNKSHYLGDANEENRVAFKAGAEWMAGKGVIIEGEVVSTDENRTSIRYTTPCYPTYHDYIYIKPIDCTKGDKVVVQIRKK